jgi:hypothetical protein
MPLRGLVQVAGGRVSLRQLDALLRWLNLRPAPRSPR